LLTQQQSVYRFTQMGDADFQISVRNFVYVTTHLCFLS
jgi:hypothetical protein